MTILINNNHGEEYRYIHALAPFILDVWNMTNTNGIFLCYHKNFGELVNCPISVEKLFGLWNKIKWYGCPNLTDVRLTKCFYCNQDIYLSQDFNWCKCTKCMHAVCLVSIYMKTNSEECQNCHRVIDIEKIDENKKLFEKE